MIDHFGCRLTLETSQKRSLENPDTPVLHKTRVYMVQVSVHLRYEVLNRFCFVCFSFFVLCDSFISLFFLGPLLECEGLVEEEGHYVSCPGYSDSKLVS